VTEDPPADAEERTRSAHRAIEIREKRRRVLSSRPALITCTAADVEREQRPAAMHAIGQRRAERPVRHGIDNRGPGRPQQTERRIRRGLVGGGLSRDVIAGRRVLHGAGRSA
jgi:hypothetical protein